MEDRGQDEALFVRSLPLMLPAAAQRLYIDAYRQSMAQPVEGTLDELSHEGAAARDAWAAVRREYREDPATLKWRRIAGQAALEETRAAKPSVLGKIRSMFKL